jgi:hypothetical protein
MSYETVYIIKISVIDVFQFANKSYPCKKCTNEPV